MLVDIPDGPPSTMVEDRLIDELERLKRRALGLVSQGAIGRLHVPFFENSGKLVRPRIVFLACFHGLELGEDVNVALARDAALAIELCHVGSLYHDDVADRSPIRRTVPALYRSHGARVASLAGAHLAALGNALAADFPSELARAWGDAGVRLSDGQLRDIERAGSMHRRVQDFVRVCSKKTGAAFELAARLGAAAGNVPKPQLEALVRFGRHLGIAFQLVDDLNDFVPRPGNNRPRANDLRERVYTLPVLYGAAQPTRIGKRIRELLQDDGLPMPDARVSELCELLVEGGALDAAVRRTMEEQASARRWLAAVEDTHARTALHDILHQLAPSVNLATAVRGATCAPT